ncbi:MAG: GAF domain-containing protein, partial [Microcoleus sp. SIO2G3]|nr:GAF domain-containing protein [Microcoleus sp. SIO2G3]
MRTSNQPQQDYNSKAQSKLDGSSQPEPLLNANANSWLLKSQENLNFKLDLQQIFAITSRLQQAENLQTLLETIAAEIQQYLQVDRSLIFRFDTEKQGTVLAESLVEGYTPSLGEILPAIAFGIATSEDQPQPFVAIDNATKSRLTPHQIQLLNRFQVQGSLSLPIWLERQLWGLLVVQQCSRDRQWQDAEILVLRQLVAELQLQMQPLELRNQRQQKAKMEPVLAQLLETTVLSSDPYTTLANLCDRLRQFYKSDRVAVYRFYPDWKGEFVAESVGAGWLSLIHAQSEDESLISAEIVNSDRCATKRYGSPVFNDDKDRILQDTQGGSYTQRQRTKRVDDIYRAGFSDCYIETLEKYQAKAYIIAPVFEGDNLWGLLAVYQCTSSRTWKDTEVTLLSLLSDRLSTVLRQLEFVGRLQEKSEQLEIQSQRLTQSVERGAAYSKLTHKLSSALLQENFSIDRLLALVVKEVRQQLSSDRVALYRFNPDWSGEFIVESASGNCSAIVGTPLAETEDNPLQVSQGGRYRQRETFCVDNVGAIEQFDFPRSLLQEWGTQAYSIAPIF